MKKYSLSVKLEKKHLLLPISNGAEMVCINVNIGGQNVREFDAELATTKEQISFWSFLIIFLNICYSFKIIVGFWTSIKVYLF